MNREQVNTRPGWDDYYLGIAAAVAKRGECALRQVGAVIVNHQSILATGYNGAPPGWPSCADGVCPQRQSTPDTGAGCAAIHAETNAIVRAGRERCLGATLYLTDEPCELCWPLIHASGLYAVVWDDHGNATTKYTGAKIVTRS